MGGLGSTRWNGVATKKTIEGKRAIDINRLNRAGCLRPGYCSSCRWMRDGEPVASIQLRREGDQLRLSYRVQQHGGDWQDVEQLIPIVWRPCRFAGVRPYFACGCGRRVAKLYGAGTYFLCRHCYHLAYASQREDRYHRALRRANHIRRRLGGEPGIAALPDRPKGMHQPTYQRLQSKIIDAEMLAEEQLAVFVDRLLPSDRRIARRSRKEFGR
jgi:hypothetical protein